MCQRACKLAIRQNIDETSSGASEVCTEIAKQHFDQAMLTARKSVKVSDIKRFEAFRASMQAGEKAG